MFTGIKYPLFFAYCFNYLLSDLTPVAGSSGCFAENLFVVLAELLLTFPCDRAYC